MKFSLVRTLPLLFPIALHAGPALAQGYPVKPIRIIVPYAPGGSTDVVFRILAPRLSENLGQQVLVENRPGAASTIGLELVAKSPPDGYTVGVANIAYGANPTLYKKMPFDAEKDLVPVSLVSIVTMVLSVHPSIPARSVKQLIALAKTKPGTLNYGSAGNGSANHLATARFAHMTGTNLVHVPYKGGGAGITDLVSGQIEMLVTSYATAAGRVKGGQVRALVLTGAARTPLMPEVPTMAEAGVPDFVLGALFGIFVPAGTPQEPIGRLAREVPAVTQSAEFRKRMVDIGQEATEPLAGEAFGRVMRAEAARWRDLAAKAGVKDE